MEPGRKQQILDAEDAFERRDALRRDLAAAGFLLIGDVTSQPRAQTDDPARSEETE